MTLVMTISTGQYWVYENWRAHGHRATVHRGDCGHCNHGSGVHAGSGTHNGSWHGPFSTADEAAALGRRQGAAVRACASCVPDMR